MIIGVFSYINMLKCFLNAKFAKFNRTRFVDLQYLKEVTCMKYTAIESMKNIPFIVLYGANTAKISNFWIFWLITLFIYHLFKIWQTLFWKMVSSGKKCIDIQKGIFYLNFRPECPEVEDFAVFLPHSYLVSLIGLVLVGCQLANGLLIPGYSNCP